MLKCFKWIVLLSTQHVPLHTIRGNPSQIKKKNEWKFERDRYRERQTDREREIMFK